MLPGAMFVCPDCGKSYPASGFCTEHGTSLVDGASDSLLGQVVGSYRISRKIGAACEAKGGEFLDAPVSGGEAGAISGQLAIMAGGKKDVFALAEPIFRALGKSYVLCGGHGAGNTVKLANQIVVAANIEAVAEALVFARKSGVDPQVAFDAIRGGLAGSKVLEAKAPMMIEGNFKPGFRLRLHQQGHVGRRFSLPDLGPTAKDPGPAIGCGIGAEGHELVTFIHRKLGAGTGGFQRDAASHFGYQDLGGEGLRQHAAGSHDPELAQLVHVISRHQDHGEAWTLQ